MKYQDFYQLSLLFFALLSVFGVGYFAYKEFFPEYKTYQHAYIDLERFRSSYTGEKPAPFSTGIKQILIADEKNGPEIIDRCISCHVAIDLPHFSPLRVARDVNDQVIYSADGKAELETNPDYIWDRLEMRIDELKHPAYHAELGEGKDKWLAEAEFLEGLRTQIIDGRRIDMAKVLRMHPLIGSETRPFEYHPMEEYGCTSCHSGNGRSLCAKRAHGPLYDEDYEPAYEIKKPQFTEKDEENDPPFSRMYNHKPGHELVFQTTPLLGGDLIVAKCVQCHQSSSTRVKETVDKAAYFADRKKERIDRIREGLENDKEALVSLMGLQRSLAKRGREGTIDWLKEELGNDHVSLKEKEALEGQLTFLQSHEKPDSAIKEELIRLTGSEEGGGSIAEKKAALVKEKKILERFQNSAESLTFVEQDPDLLSKIGTEVDQLIVSYNRGKELFVSQACYACHRIAGYSRASIGPELTYAGTSYPWFIKESIVWPQADLPSSTMPNFRLDHEEIENLMTFLMAQTGCTKAVSEVDYHISLKDWEAGGKLPWEKPVAPTKIKDARAGMHVFVTEGCASCHKLEGFESNVGFVKGGTLEEREWFYRLIPEQAAGSRIAEIVETKAEEIDARIVEGVRQDGIIEEIRAKYPGLVEGFYSNFKYPSRAMNTAYKDDPEKLKAYQERLNRVLMIYIQLYGMGRDIAPHLNWSGIYRDDAWLLGHFHNPSAYTARSIMPVMPFDDTKFYMLNNMLRQLGAKNRDRLREIWREQGFDPPLAYHLLCSSCHGVQRQGNGIISEWIYPIPKNLRNPVFLRNLTKERAIDSIKHGVRGTPMPPWGEAASATDPDPVLTHPEIVQLVDWLYQGLPEEHRRERKEDYEKWSYSPHDVVKEMRRERDFLEPAPPKNENLAELASDYFESRPNPVPGPDKELYYIRDQYFTDSNLKEAEKFYLVNCATCHGKEGGGTGLRATSMVEAKPRMLTNLPWLRTRDDLRLLRSIKYGVPGTGMIPWGDMTTSAQRMQLVIFIRELTRTQMLNDEFEEVLYDAFDRQIQTIEEARVSEYARLEADEAALKSAQEKLYEGGGLSPEEAGRLYVKIAKLKKEAAEGEAQDDRFKALIELVKEQKESFRGAGGQLIGTQLPDRTLRDFFEMVRGEALRFHFEKGKLEIKENREAPTPNSLIDNLNLKIAEIRERIKIEEARIPSPERGKTIQNLMEEEGTYINLRTKLAYQFAEAKKMRNKQREIYETLYQSHP
ncbi:MAG: c-type cytochrome [Chlamydiales bacterium]|nr:c-type cytochrome [Chlamydiales bacterium]